MTEPPDASVRIEALADALRHVMADALNVTALARFARWNTARTAPHAHRALFRRRLTAGRRAQEAVARHLLTLGAPVALHPTDPSEVPRWMLAAQSEDSLAQVALLAAGAAEFVASVEAAVEVAREVPDASAVRTLTRLARRERGAMAEMRALAQAELLGRRASASGLARP